MRMILKADFLESIQLDVFIIGFRFWGIRVIEVDAGIGIFCWLALDIDSIIFRILLLRIIFFLQSIFLLLGILINYDFRWFHQQAHLADLQRCKVTGIELVVIIIREISAQKLEVRLADHVASRLGNQTEDAGLLMQLVGILARLVVVLETVYLQAMQPLEVFDADVEIARHIGGEVILGYLEEQLVFVDGIWTVGEQEDKPVVAVG